MAGWGRLEDREIAEQTGRLVLSNPAPGVFYTLADGRLGVEAASVYTQYGDEIGTQDGRHIGLHDWWSMTGYEPGVRQHVVTWSMKVISRWDEIHVALRSHVVKMGVNLANIALGGKISVHTRRESFEEVFLRVRDAASRAGGAP